jgi:hypothetical protein
MTYLPDPEERRGLLAELERLLQARGTAPFLVAPLEPTPACFPDPWSPDPEGAAALLARIMNYAGLGQLGLRLQVADAMQAVTDHGANGSSTHSQGAAAWFHGIADGVAAFGVDHQQLADPEGLTAAMCHEVAHAYRHQHGLVGDSALEELRTDLTTVYLGFGILTTNATQRTRTSHEIEGGRVSHRMSQSNLGYLSPQAMSFALAAQAASRGAGWWARRRLASFLEPNQAAYFQASFREVARSGWKVST